MPQTVYVGLAVTSVSNGILCTAEFDNVVVSTGDEPGPAPGGPDAADLLAYWAFDETSGRVAPDSVGGIDGVLLGGPVWRPGGGMVGGALEFDGVNDAVLTDFVLDPAEGPFSVFAWVRGGAPGEVIISQDSSQGGADWLMTDPSRGRLMTDLTGSRGTAGSLSAAMVITDGDWYEVGLAWDGTDRTLYVNGVVVAGDTQTTLAGSTGGLNIGAGKNLDGATHWTGLIDDVRLYNRAVSP